jgi:hypothetical protein
MMVAVQATPKSSDIPSAFAAAAIPAGLAMDDSGWCRGKKQQLHSEKRNFR